MATAVGKVLATIGRGIGFGLDGESTYTGPPAENPRSPPLGSYGGEIVPFERGGPNLDRQGYGGLNYGFRSWRGYDIVPPLYSCIMLLSRTAAGIPLIGCKEGRPSERMRDSVLDMILRQPSMTIPRTRFWLNRFMETFALGQSFVYIQRSQGVPVELIPARLPGYGGRSLGAGTLARARDITVQIPGRDIDEYRYNVSPSDLLCFFDESWDPFSGRALNPLVCKARNPHALYAALMRMYARGTANGGHQKVYMTVPDSSDERKKMKKAWEEWAAGVDNTGLPFLIGAGGDIKTASFSAEQQQVVEMLRRLDIEICRLMGVDPRFVYADDPGISARARTTLSEAHTAWLDHGFRSVLATFAEEITLKLGDPATGEEAVFDTSLFSMGTFRDRVAVADQAVAKAPLMTTNEAREEILERAALPGDENNQIRPTKGAPPAAAMAAVARALAAADPVQ